MLLTSNDNNMPPSCGFTIDQTMNMIDKRTSCINALQPLFVNKLIRFARNAMCAYDNRAFLGLECFTIHTANTLFVLDHFYASFLQSLHHFFVVDDRTVCMNCLSCLQLLIHCIDCPFYTKTKSCGFRHHHFHHSAPLSHKSIMASATCSIVSFDESTSTASSACISGESSRCIS